MCIGGNGVLESRIDRSDVEAHVQGTDGCQEEDPEHRTQEEDRAQAVFDQEDRKEATRQEGHEEEGCREEDRE